MKISVLPELLYRAHSNAYAPLSLFLTTHYRFDDFRRPPQFCILYTGGTIEGCFIEKIQKYRGSDPDANLILASIRHASGDPPKIPPTNCVPAKVLRDMAASTLRVLDTTAEVVELTAIETLNALPEKGNILGIHIPISKPADFLKTGYRLSQRASAIIHDATLSMPKIAGIISRSSLDDFASADHIHLNYNLYRKTPTNGGDLRVPLDRIRTVRALDEYRDELSRALQHLQATPALPLDHPDLTATI